MAEEKTKQTKQKKQTNSKNSKEEEQTKTKSKAAAEHPPTETSKELQAIFDALNVYIDKHNGEVQFALDISAFDKNGNVVDDKLCLYGFKDCLEVAVDALDEAIKNHPDNFISG